MPIGPVPNQNHHHGPRRRPERKQLLHFFFNSITTVAVVFISIFFFGFNVTIFFMSNTRRHNISDRSLPTPRVIVPAVRYRALDFPMMLDCAICLDSFREGDEYRNLRICKHLFHSKCVDRWIEKNPSCPVCRTRVDL
ncbi:hypothetical protein CASFOL_038303 [Castilleja foliolosa]|uniref:RING-type domain-containing protein n=1 Tax=Castilleja foliolosa TaxID=1961234 RepID=A0ABD3BL07_9LAMI